jgi:threonine dehydrogenase-like Zn-dependent dehydrogenase
LIPRAGFPEGTYFSGVVSRVGVPQYEEANVGFARMFFRNITLTGGVAPARAYIGKLLPDVLDGTIEPGLVFDRTIEPGLVFDRTVSLDEVPDGYRAMNDRRAIKVLISP